MLPEIIGLRHKVKSLKLEKYVSIKNNTIIKTIHNLNVNGKLTVICRLKYNISFL